jgi:hypothetical protein
MSSTGHRMGPSVGGCIYPAPVAHRSGDTGLRGPQGGFLNFLPSLASLCGPGNTSWPFLVDQAWSSRAILPQAQGSYSGWLRTSTTKDDWLTRLVSLQHQPASGSAVSTQKEPEKASRPVLVRSAIFSSRLGSAEPPGPPCKEVA